MGKSESTISRFCNNNIQPSVETLTKIAQLLKIDVQELLYRTKNTIK
ncbi:MULTISPECIES: helix-turn-helix transcriptional regulator [unclassified Sphingobacterium]|nr:MULTISPECIES: helix-turn-helix transcriptional regulator [unclassified Sphingobacterium]